jgi:hypothetical protein
MKNHRLRTESWVELSVDVGALADEELAQDAAILEATTSAATDELEDAVLDITVAGLATTEEELGATTSTLRGFAELLSDVVVAVFELDVVEVVDEGALVTSIATAMLVTVVVTVAVSVVLMVLVAVTVLVRIVLLEESSWSAPELEKSALLAGMNTSVTFWAVESREDRPLFLSTTSFVLEGAPSPSESGSELVAVSLPPPVLLLGQLLGPMGPVGRKALLLASNAKVWD